MTSAASQARSFNIETAVRDRYSRAAGSPDADLCCPVEYDRRHLEIIPQEIIDRDYGCGNPAAHVAPGDVVLDLGSGGGKVCYIAAQIVGPNGRVIGVDCNDDMIQLARKYQSVVGNRLGFDNVEFRKGKIQDLRLDLELLDEYLADHPVTGSTGWLQLDEHAHHLRNSSPLIDDQSINVVISNCVLNLVRSDDRRQLFHEMHRVLKRGGRAVISDIVADEDVPPHLRDNVHLWSGCISGAFREDRFLEAFEEAGFYGIELLDRQSEPWAVVEGIEFRSVTVRAFKGKEGPCLDRRQAVVYNGPWKAVVDDDGHTLLRGKRMAVCDKTFQLYTRAPYAGQITPVPPREPVPLESAPPFDCSRSEIRSPAETKRMGGDIRRLTILPHEACCGPDDCC